MITTFRPDEVMDPDHEAFAESLPQLGDLTGEDVMSWKGYLRALENRRAYFREHGATATDHGPATAQTADLSPREAEALSRPHRSAARRTQRSANCSAPRC